MPERTAHSGWLAVKEVADILGVHPNTVYGRIRKGELPATRFGCSWRVPEASTKFWDGGWRQAVEAMPLDELEELAEYANEVYEARHRASAR